MPQLDTIKTRQEAHLAELNSETADIDHQLRQPYAKDDEERAQETEGDEVLEGLGNQALREIAGIEAALARIEAGTYGECTQCSKDISPARLEAMPAAALCIDCAD
ncbi:MAG: TraR/DksA C4-type zinc finger protein [Rhodospirillaceae bacterium]